MPTTAHHDQEEILPRVQAIPNRLEIARKNRDLTQKELATVLRVPVKNIRSWERTILTAREEKLLRYLAFLGQSVASAFPEYAVEARYAAHVQLAAFRGIEPPPVPCRPQTVLGLNPGGQYLAWSVFVDRDLRRTGVFNLCRPETRTPSGLGARVERVTRELLDEYRPSMIVRTKLGSSTMSPRCQVVAEAADRTAKTAHVPIEVLPAPMARAYVTSGKSATKVELAELLARRYPVLFDKLRVRPPAVPGRATHVGFLQRGFIDALCVGYAGACLADLLNRKVPAIPPSTAP